MGKSAARHSGKEAMIVCLSPDVCLTPMGPNMVPVPYMIVSRLDWSQRTVSNITFGGQEAFTMDSRTGMVSGNEPATGGGIKSGINTGWCRPLTNKSNVIVNGHPVLQDGCIYEMNCDGPDGTGNTLGKLRFVE